MIVFPLCSLRGRPSERTHAAGHRSRPIYETHIPLSRGGWETRRSKPGAHQPNVDQVFWRFPRAFASASFLLASTRNQDAEMELRTVSTGSTWPLRIPSSQVWHRILRTDSCGQDDCCADWTRVDLIVSPLTKSGSGIVIGSRRMRGDVGS